MTLIGLLSSFLISQVCIANPITSGEVITPQSFIQKQVGGGKASIEILKEGKARFCWPFDTSSTWRSTQTPRSYRRVLAHRKWTRLHYHRWYKNFDQAGDFIYMPARAEVSFKNVPVNP